MVFVKRYFLMLLMKTEGSTLMGYWDSPLNSLTFPLSSCISMEFYCVIQKILLKFCSIKWLFLTYAGIPAFNRMSVGSLMKLTINAFQLYSGSVSLCPSLWALVSNFSCHKSVAAALPPAVLWSRDSGQCIGARDVPWGLDSCLGFSILILVSLLHNERKYN